MTTDAAATPAEILELVEDIERRAVGSLDPVLRDAVLGAVASILGPAPRPLPRAASPAGPTAPGPTRSPAEVAACVAFAEQFVVDVAATTDEQRSAMTEAMGRDAFTFVQVVYVLDVLRRMHIGLDRLGLLVDRDPVPSPAGGGTGERATDAPVDLWGLLERFMQDVARLDALDPLTAELVRLRGAAAHDCRLCRSRRSVRALDAAPDPTLLGRVLDGAEAVPELTDRQRVALAVTDALVTQPSTIDAALAAEVREQLSDAEAVELVLDVARNAANKIAVSLGADGAVVTGGIEFYDLDATGTVVADADIASVRAATG